MRARRAGAVIFLALLTLSVLLPNVQAAGPVPVKVTITKVRDVGGNLEDDFGTQGPPDFYGKIAINGVWFETPRAPDDTSVVYPFWNWTVSIPEGQPTTNVSIEIWDKDVSSSDDIGDASPLPNDDVLDFTVDLATGSWQGDVQPGATCTIGDGRTRAEVCWTVEVQPRLTLTKEVSAATAAPGETVTYTLSLGALGNTTQASLVDPLPPEMTYVPGSLTIGSYDEGRREIRFDGAITPAGPLVITYQATVNGGLSPGTTIASSARLTGAEETIERRASVTVGEAAFDGTLVLIYVAGDNNLSDAALKLVNQAETATDNPHALSLLLIDGPGADDAYLYQLLPQASALQSCPSYQNPTCDGSYVEGQTLWRWSDDVGSAASLTDFLNQTIQAYPHAQRRVLSLVGHGGGWSPELLADQPTRHYPQPPGDTIGGMLWDDHPGNSLSTPELGQALRASRIATGKRIDLLYLDACTMAMAEVAYELRDSAHYLLASEHTKWAAFPYDQHLSTIDASADPHVLGEQWLANEAHALGPLDPFTYSLTDLDAIDDVRAASDELANALLPFVAEPQARALIAEAVEQTDCFDSNGDGLLTKEDDYCDLASFARAIGARFSATSPIVPAAQRVEQAVSRAVVANQYRGGVAWIAPTQRWDWNNLSGLSIFLPLREDTWRRGYYGLIQFTRDGAWDAFINAWWANTSAPVSPTCPPPGCDLPIAQPAVPYRVYFPFVVAAP